MKKNSALTLIVLLTALPVLNACVPLVLTGAAAAVVDVSLDRRTPGTYIDDNALEVKLRRDTGNDDALAGGVNISVTAFNGVVLLTGQVNTDEQRARAGEWAQGYVDAGEAASVVNELELAGKTNWSSRLNDAWITGKVKARLLRARESVPVSAVKVVTEHGKVYLLGRVTRAEADAAVEFIRDINGITHIVKVFEYAD